MEKLTSLIFSGKISKTDGDINELFSKCLLILKAHDLPPPHQIEKINNGQCYNNLINGYEDEYIKKQDFINTSIQSKKEEYIFNCSHVDDEYSLSILIQSSLVKNNKKVQIGNIFNTVIKILNSIEFAYTYDLLSRSNLNNLYAPFELIGRSSQFLGLYWLNYLGPEEITLNGGEALYNLPYLTKAKPLGDGILIQVGESLKYALTEVGQQQLFKATEAWWEMIQEQDAQPPRL